jgi:hypothetical protein
MSERDESQSFGDTYSGKTGFDDDAPSVTPDNVEVYYSSGDPKAVYDEVMSSDSPPIFETYFHQSPPNANDAPAMFKYNQMLAIDQQRFGYLLNEWNKSHGAAQSTGRGAAQAAETSGLCKGSRASLLNNSRNNSRNYSRERNEGSSGGRRTKRSNRKNKRSASKRAKRKISGRRRSSRK